MPNFAGKWAYDSSDGVDKLLDLMQVPTEKRDPSKLTDSTVEIVQDGDNFEITTTGGLGKAGTSSFTVGGSYTTELMGKEVKGVSSWDGDALVMKGEKGAVLRRELVGDNLVYSIQVGDVSAKITMRRS